MIQNNQTMIHHAQEVIFYSLPLLKQLIEQETQIILLQIPSSNCQYKRSTIFLRKINKLLFTQALLLPFLNKFAVLIEKENINNQIVQCSFQLKKFYVQSMVNEDKITRDQFQFLVVILVKNFCNFFKKSFREIQIGEQEESDIYSIYINTFLGVRISHKAYKLVEQKYIEKKDILNQSFIKKNANSLHSSRNMTLKSLQNKIQSRKLLLKRMKTDRISLRVSQLKKSTSNLIKSFQSNLKENLKTKFEVKKKPKIKFASLEDKEKVYPQDKQQKQNYNKKNVINSQQLSSTLELSLYENKSVYTKKNVKLRLHLLKSTRFTHEVVITSDQVDNFSLQDFSINSIVKQPEIVTQKSTVKIMRKTKAYWSKVLNDLKNEPSRYEN